MHTFSLKKEFLNLRAGLKLKSTCIPTVQLILEGMARQIDLPLARKCKEG